MQLVLSLLVYKRTVHNEGQAASKATEETFYKDEVIGISYAINDSLSISYNSYESYRHDNDTENFLQDTTAINIGYTVGGMTIGFQDAQTDNAGYATDTKDDTRTQLVFLLHSNCRYT